MERKKRCKERKNKEEKKRKNKYSYPCGRKRSGHGKETEDVPTQPSWRQCVMLWTRCAPKGTLAASIPRLEFEVDEFPLRLEIISPWIMRPPTYMLTLCFAYVLFR